MQHEPRLSPGVADLPALGMSALWTWLGFIASLVALARSLWLSVGMHLKACPLCLYQRTFVMGAVAVLTLSLLLGMQRARWASFLALPCAIAGLAVAVFHLYLEAIGKLECPRGILDLGTGPQQSVAALFLLVSALVFGTLDARRHTGAPSVRSLGCAVLLGLLLAYGAIASAPPMPSAPERPYAQAPDICRPPYRPN